MRDRRGLLAAMKHWRNGPVQIVISKLHATRSLSQNAWYWSQVVGLVAEHTGYTPEEIHDIYKAKFIPKALALQDGNGEVVESCVIGGSTRVMNKIEFGEYCERIREWAADELGVVIPDPDPDWQCAEDTKGVAV